MSSSRLVASERRDDRRRWEQLDEQARRPVEKLMAGLVEIGFRIEEAYVFGSRTRGDWLNGSNVDIIVVSRDFASLKHTERLDLVYRLAWWMRLDPWVGAIPLTLGELEEKLSKLTMIRDASRRWVRVPPTV